MVITNKRIQLKFFLGCLLTTDLEAQLYQNQEWKQSRIMSGENNRFLQEAYFQEKKYLGLFLDQSAATYTELQDLDREIRETLLRFCVDLPIDTFKIFIFSQIFIT